MPPSRHLTLTPLSPARSHPGGRAAMTCHYKCGDACSQPLANESDNDYFGDVVAASISRRTVLRAGAAGAALVGLVGSGAGADRAAAAAPAATAVDPVATGAGAAHPGGRLWPMGFRGIDPVPSSTDRLVVPKGWTWRPVIRWGDPLFDDAPEFDAGRQSATAQSRQFGYNNDYTVLIPRRRNKATLVCNHEYTNDEFMFPGIEENSDLSDEQLRTILAAHGMSVVELRRRGPGHPWSYVRGGRRNRRITSSTPFRFTGPAAGSPLLRTSADPTGRVALGTLNNCAGGLTPWGTVLSGEENVEYFRGDTVSPTAANAKRLKRYGLTSKGRGWDRVESRFDISKEPNEPHRFNWVVEIDPDDPDSTPRKHTALGRVKHEGANVVVDPDGRVVVYTGDDSKFEYLYKFVSARRFDRGSSEHARRHNMRLLEAGDLYVARFTGDGAADGVHDGTGRWLPLTKDGRSMVPGMSIEEVLVFTREAADTVGATKMDRPEDVEWNPHNNKVYMACTNNSDRKPGQIDEANPRAANKHGQVVEFGPTNGHHASTEFVWDLVLVCGDPKDPATYYAGFDKSKVTPISCPDNVTFDSRGNLWIATDGQPGSLKHCDGLFMMPLEGPERGHLVQFLSVPVGAETCGPVVSFDERTVMVAIQHPGEVDGATFATPASRFPYDGGFRGPRPSVVQVFRR
ncbi:PhoX family protein [Agilicoccus flavus]|uniref:PhoX family protein n=1 Tax=Agilicoccus flavus TaxID=2775968 RepID=UPI001CF6F81E|nr:PhoX family phosphatase [Agilicoccus flavus]